MTLRQIDLMPIDPTPAAFMDAVTADPVNASLLDRLPNLDLPQGYLVAGCLFQAVWNWRSRRRPGDGVRDYDVVYFDPDLSWEAEDAVIRRVEAVVRDLGVTVEVRNQARVHLWFEQRFGGPYPALRSARDAIDRYLVSCTCVGIEVGSGQVYAPNGFGDLIDGILELNPRTTWPALFARKAADYRARWPWLTVVAPRGIA